MLHIPQASWSFSINQSMEIPSDHAFMEIAVKSTSPEDPKSTLRAAESLMSIILCRNRSLVPDVPLYSNK